ncbi:MAG: DUF1349 domain-containing protein [Chitinivibrionales bacterium]|nr:DUF1349 domain-containing protein [Chitinivibrionales bacterium]
MNILRCIIALIALGLLVRCSLAPVAAGPGTGSETTNGITAAIVRSNGAPAAGALVRLRRSDWATPLPALAKSAALSGADALTDSNGQFRISDVDPGAYMIEVNDGKSAAVLMACTLGTKTTADLGVDTLRSYATIIGAVDTISPTGTQFFVQVSGLEKLVIVGVDGQYRLTDLPPGVFSLRIVSNAGSIPTIVNNVWAVGGDTSVASSPLPAPWMSASIGNETPAGGAMYANGVFTITGGGKDIFYQTDGFHFVYQPVSGDFRITARVTGLEIVENFSKAALLFRQDTSANAAYIAFDIDAWDTAGSVYYAGMFYRPQKGAASYNVLPHRFNIVLPEYIRLERKGTLFSGYVSSDGSTWELLDQQAMNFTSDVLVGLAVTSHTVSHLCTSVFDHVTIDPTP